MKMPAYIQALKSRQRDHLSTHTYDSRSSSPRDSGLAVSSSGSDFETDFRGSSSMSPPVSSTFSSYGGASFKNSLAFFQRAANLVSTNTKNIGARDRHRESKRSSKRHNGGRQLHNEDLDLREKNEGSRYHCVDGSKNLEVDLNKLEDHETYEQVLFINGKPQYKDDMNHRSHSFDALLDSRNTRDADNNYSETTTTIRINSDHNSRRKLSSSPCPDRRRSSSWTRVQIRPEDTSALDDSVDCEPLQRALGLSDATYSKSLSDVTTCITLPRRKPVLNFGSVSDDRNDIVNGLSSAGVFNNSFERTGYRDRRDNETLKRPCTITRAHSFKEGLDFANECFGKASPLSRTQSCYDGLAKGFKDTEGFKPKLSRAPSVDEILESVKSLRAKRNTMVRSSPDLLQTMQEKNYHSSSRHKSSKSKSSKNANSSSTISGVRYNGSSSIESKREKTHTTSDYDRVHSEERHYYENINSGNQYENLPAKKVEAVYDSPKSIKVVEKRRHSEKRIDPPIDHYENVNFDPQYYENVNTSEPTYMNVGEKTVRKSKLNSDQLLKHNNHNYLYANIEETSQNSKTNVKKNRNGKVVVVTGTSTTFDDSQTYDVPKAASHIYDTPPKQTRQVRPQSTSKRKPEEVENEYDTPQNNRSVIPQSAQILLKSKNEQIKKIDDIFADCEKDSLEENCIEEKSPDIPPPDYGSEEDDLTTESSRAKSSSPSADYIDEGLGESDSRSYYADEQGLEVILEEPEEDYCSSHSSEDDLRRRVDLQLRLKGERRSLDGSEGIGSAEGDSHSSGSEIGGEEDCASSGVHSEDTSSPGPPPDHCKEDPSQHILQDVSKEFSDGPHSTKKEEDRIQKDRCIEIYPETLRQRQRNMAPSPSKVDIKNWEPTSAVSNEEDAKGKKFLPSVKALRNQFENGKPVSRDIAPSTSPPSSTLGRTSSSSSTSSLIMSSLDASSGFGSLTSSQTTIETLPIHLPRELLDDDPVEPIFSQFKGVDDELKELMSKPPSTAGWNPQPLLKRLYYVPDAPKIHSQGTAYINIEGYLEKLPSGRKKATFWNAWKRRFFVAKDGIFYYYQNNQTEKPSMKLPLMGGKIEIMDPNMVSVDDGKGHYVVVRCSSRQEAERWKRALETHTVDDFSSQYVQPWPRPTNPTLLRDTLVIDIGSCSVRAGVLTSQATLPQLFFPSVLATNRESRRQVWGMEGLMPDVRSGSSITFPVRPSHKISKFSVDLNAISSLLQKTFQDLKVDPKNYNIQLSVPRILNPHTQAELLKILFDKYGVKSVNLTHQSILALYAYNATSGIVVDIGERMDVVPVIDGYIVDGGVSRVPYGGYRIMDHLRQFLFQRNVSLVNEVESYIIRQVLETVCYCAQHYNTEKSRCTMNPENFEKTVPLEEFFPSTSPQFEIFQNISLEFGRFQATEGLFNPDAWGLDHPGLHKLVHKAIQECSMDIRKEMSRSIFLAGGVTQLPGIAERLTIELDNLTPPAIRPKVHSSPYRYHAAYLGACVLAESPAFAQSKITKEEWHKQGNSAIGKWSL